MLNLYITVLTKRPNKDGSFNIKIAVNHERKTAYIPTPFSIDSLNQWRYGQVVNHPQAGYMNTQLQRLLLMYMQIRDTAKRIHGDARYLRDWLVHEASKTSYVKEYATKLIEDFKANKQYSYAKNMEYTIRYFCEIFGDNIEFDDINIRTLEHWEKCLRKRGNSETTINIRMSHLKAVLNSAVTDELVEYKVFPFAKYKMPTKGVRDICISREELVKVRDFDFSTLPRAKCQSRDSTKRYTVARDLFMLSFYCAGINLTDIIDADFDGEILTFIRKKTADKKHGEKKVSITIQPEARAIIEKYYKNGKFDFGYNYSDYEQFRSYVTKSLNKIGAVLELEKKLMFYSARKTFCQFGFELGIPLYILEYSIGQTIKDANNRPIYNYIKIMRSQADAAIRSILDYVNEV